MNVWLTVQPHTQFFVIKDIFRFDNVSTISSTVDLIEGSKRANIMLPNESMFHINDALYYSKSTRNLLNFKDIRRNGSY